MSRIPARAYAQWKQRKVVRTALLVVTLALAGSSALFFSQFAFANDGDGTMVVDTPTVVGNTSNTLTFTYTAANDFTNGVVRLTIPAGFPDSEFSNIAVDCTGSAFGGYSVDPRQVTIDGVNITTGQTCTFTYGPVAAPATGGDYEFTSYSQEDSGGSPQPLGTSPTVHVLAPNGSGTMDVSPTFQKAGNTATETFTYTAATGGMSGGRISVAAPAGWTAPQTADNMAAGFVTKTCDNGDSGTLDTDGGQVIRISNLTLDGGQQCTIVYGDTSGDPGGAAVVGSSYGPNPFDAEQGANSNTTSPLSSSPSVFVGVDHFQVRTTGGSDTTTPPAGVASDIKVTALDAQNATMASFTGDQDILFSGAFASPGPATSPTVSDTNGSDVPFGTNMTVTFSGGVADVDGTQMQMKLYDVIESFIVATGTGNDSGATTSGGDRLDATVTPATATRLKVTGSSVQTAGNQQSITVTALDPYGNTDTNYTGDQQITFGGGTDAPGGQHATVTDNLAAAQDFGDPTTITFSNGMADTGVDSDQLDMTLVKAGTENITAADPTNTISASTGSDRLTVDVSPAAADHLTFTSSIANLTAGATRNLTAEVRDQFGNVETGDNSTVVTFSKDSGAGSVNFTGGSDATAASGVATKQVTGITAGSITLRAHSGTLTDDTQTFTIDPGAAHRLNIGGNASQTAGTSNQLTITALDDFGNVVSSGPNDYDGDKTLKFSGAADSTNPVTHPSVSGKNGADVDFGTNTTVTFSHGVADNNGTAPNQLHMKLYKAESTNVAAADQNAPSPSASGGDRLSVTVSAAVATRLKVTGSATQTAGASQNITLTALDPYGNTDTGFIGDHGISFGGATDSPGGNHPTASNKSGTDITFGTGTTITFALGVASNSVDPDQLAMKLYNVESANITAASSGDSIPASTGTDRLGVSVSPASATRLKVTGSATQTAGTQNLLTLTALDPYGNTDTNFTSDHTVVFSGASDAPNGQHPFTLNKNGSGANFGSGAPYTFAAGVATQSTGGSSADQLKMTLRNAETANVAAADTGDGIGASTGTDRLTVTVSAAAATRLKVTGSATQTAGTTQDITLTALDPFGNTDTSYTSQHVVTFGGGNTSPGGTHATVTDGDAGRTPRNFGTGTDIDFSNGVADQNAFSGQLAMKLVTAETEHITAASGSISASTGSDILDVTVSPASANAMSVTGSATQTAGTSQNVTLTAYDAFQNVATGYSGDKNVIITGAFPSPNITNPTVTDKTGAAISLGLVTTITFASGVANNTVDPDQLSMKLYKAEVATIFASESGGIGSLGSLEVTVSEAALDHFKVEKNGGGNIAPQTAGTAFSIQVTAQDAYDNTRTAFTGTVDVSSTSGCEFGCATTGSFTSGVLTGWSISLTDAGSQTISVVNHSGSETGTSNFFDVGAAALDHFAVEANGGGDIPEQIAGQPFSPPIQITAQDQFDNTVTSFTGTVDVSSNRDCADGCATTGPFSGGQVSAYSITLDEAGDGAVIDVTDTATGDYTGESNEFTVDAAALDHFAVEADGGGDIDTQTAGGAFDIQVTAQDQFDNTVTSFTDTVDVSSNRDCADGCATSGPFVDGQLQGYSVTLDEAGDGAVIDVVDTDTGDYSGESNEFTVDPAALDHFAVEADGGGDIDTQTAGTPIDIQVTAQDVYDNTVTSFVSTVDVSSNRDCADGCDTSGAFTDGQLQHYHVTLTEAGDGAVIDVADTATGDYTGESNEFTVDPSTLDHFAVEADGGGDIDTQTAGSSFDVQFTAEDVYDNTVSSFTGTVDVSSNRDCSAGCDTSGSFTDGQLTGHSLTLTEAGDGAVVDVVDHSGSATGESNEFTVDPSTLDHLAVEADGGGDIGTQTAGSSFDIQVTAQDVYDNTVPTFTGKVDVSSNRDCSAGCATSGSFTDGQLTGHSLTLTEAGDGAVVDVVDHSGSATGESNEFTVDPAALDHFAVEADGGGDIGDQTAGTSFATQVTAQDAYDNTVTGFTGKVDVSSNRDCSAGCTTSAAFTDGQLQNHSVTLTEAGAGSVVDVVNHAGAQTGESNDFTVMPAAFSKFSVEKDGGGAIGTQTAGVSFDIQVTAQDQYGNTTPSFVGAVDITSNRTCSQGCTTNVGPFVDGVFTGQHVKITTAGTGAHITATNHAPGGQTGTSNNFTVNTAAADHVTYTSNNVSVASGSTKTLTVEIRDAFENKVDSGATVNFAKTAGAGTVSPMPTSAAAVHGVATKVVTGHDAGSITVQAGSTGLTPDTSTFSVTPGTATKLVFTSATSNLASGTVRTLKVEIRDADDNKVVTPAHSVTLTKISSSGTGTVTGLPATVTSASGIASKAVAGNVAGPLTIRATSSGLVSGMTTFTVTPGVATKLVFTSATTQLASGTARTLTAQIQDAAGNKVTSPNRSVAFAKVSGTGTVTNLPATVTSSAGTASKSVTGALAGTISIRATASGLTSATTTFTVIPGAAKKLVFTSSTANLRTGTTRTLTVQVQDAAGNKVTSPAKSVTFAKLSGTGTVTGIPATVTSSSGTASRAVKGAALGTITIKATSSGLTQGTTTFRITSTSKIGGIGPPPERSGRIGNGNTNPTATSGAGPSAASTETR